MKQIPNELSENFNTQEGRKKLIELYSNGDSMFFGTNEDNESVYVSIAENGIILRTEQDNGWVRVNFYDSEGIATGETFDGKWKALNDKENQ